MVKTKKPSSYSIAKAAGVLARAGMRGKARKRKAPYKFGGVSNYRTGGFIGIERKFLDCGFNSVAVSTSTTGADGEMQPSSGCTGCISAPVQGNGEQERDGRRYNLKSCHVSGILDTTTSQDSADALEQFGTFVALVLDTQANAQTIVSENVYINPSTGTGGMMPYPLRNLANTRRFRILDSQYIKPGGMYAFPDGASTGSLSNQNGGIVKLSWTGNIPVDSVGTTADIASVSNNALHVIAYTAGFNTPTFIGKSRVRFVG